MNRRLVLPDRPNARRGEKLRVNGVLEIAEQSAQALLSYQFLHITEMNPYYSCVGVYARYHARNRILRFRALRAPATKSLFSSIDTRNQRAAFSCGAEIRSVSLAIQTPCEHHVDPFDQILPHLPLRGPEADLLYRTAVAGRAAQSRMARFSI